MGGVPAGDDVSVSGAVHDSREVTGDVLFVPVRADRDGHDFIEAAVERGAVAYFTARAPRTDSDATAISVPDPERALSRWAVAARKRLPDRVIAVTGSVGKTSTKDLAAAVLRTELCTHASPRSFNNELGVPLTVVNAPEGTGAMVVEMGARGIGHVRELCGIARPTIAVVTTVELVHTEQFGSIERVAAAKRELVEAIPATGTVVLNQANEHVAAMAGHAVAPVLGFGRKDSDLWAERLELDGELRPRFVLRTPWGSAAVRLGVRGEHNVANALAAAGAALAAGITLEGVATGLGSATLSPWRMELLVAPSGARVLNDSYNAGPTSMAAALRALSRLDATRHVAVLGQMAELGVHEAEAHHEIAMLADDLDIEVVAVGAPAYDGPRVQHVVSLEQAADAVGRLGRGDAVLVKGSRVAGLERLAATLATGH